MVLHVLAPLIMGLVTICMFHLVTKRADDRNQCRARGCRSRNRFHFTWAVTIGSYDDINDRDRNVFRKLRTLSDRQLVLLYDDETHAALYRRPPLRSVVRRVENVERILPDARVLVVTDDDPAVTLAWETHHLLKRQKESVIFVHCESPNRMNYRDIIVAQRIPILTLS